MFDQMKKQMENSARQMLTAALERSSDFVKDSKNALLEIVSESKGDDQ